MAVLIFFAVLLVLVIAHEWGHFIVAKKTGMRVDEFGFGFPPKLWGKKYNGTEYSLNALPLGGFVKIYGEDSLLKSDEERAADPDFKHSFIAKPRWAQALVLVAGVTMNALVAWVLFSVIFMVGANTVVSEEEATNARLTVMSVAADSAASEARVPVGAEIIEVQRKGSEAPELVPSAFRAFTGASTESISITYKLGDEVTTVLVEPQTGKIAEEPLRPVVGLSVALVETVSYPVHEAVWHGLTTTGTQLYAVADGLLQFFSRAVVGQANLDEVSGPIGLVSMVGSAAQNGFVALMQLTAFISLNLVVINLLPFPALDGGRLLFVAIEAVRRKALPSKLVLYANAAGFVFLLGLMAVVTVSDIVKLF
ncbi:hypothetical protein A3C89_02340 [Candidatus Kaiserbacteria bacterium RIFCSPHIGHO2_02_FULL_50_50]|uniref:Peptidase M50 domain-containing protein n=1 Tax=Candidatus Kaiserbacteria bacterium RIFCSPHIGHO2_02_FULL_50_50 TaxID=1798492 RepID=A0A1F6DG78_9BACT|nr:MAG: hypothetical protein A3C89_02340 [Candidatus Kaiserbacteria bacterium RIFCSPHIGHO2_02_FULL_50_50]OGG88282.1 MAG: hypothetical protein A3G62_02560 [Candidatus Kaiserbacteria bacterium RIFCSPLOWO2_12_FULL_50_10]